LVDIFRAYILAKFIKIRCKKQKKKKKRSNYNNNNNNKKNKMSSDMKSVSDLIK